MPHPKGNLRVPAYRHFKPKNLGVVRIAGHDYYLGPYDSPESHEKYRRLIAEWVAKGQAPAPARATTAPVAPTVDDVILAFLVHAEAYYVGADGAPTGELDNYRDALRPLRELHDHTLARDFGPRELKIVRERMVAAGLARTTINRRIGRVVHVFKFGVSEGLIPASIHQALATVDGLRRGRSGAKESSPVRPVPEAFVDAIEPFVARQVWAMVGLQRHSGMRPGEVVIMRTCDLDTSGKVWVYTPEHHKTEHHGQARRIYLGPRAQEILRPWLSTDLTAYLFSPEEAMAERRAEMRQARASKVQPSQRSRATANPRRSPQEHYSPNSYRQAIVRACQRAQVPPWSPGRLRHNTATRLRKEFGLDVTSSVLGHADPATTTIYAERDDEAARSAMERLG